MPAASQVRQGCRSSPHGKRASLRTRARRTPERRAHGPRRRPGKQQVDQHRRAGLSHQRAGDARDGPGGEIEAGADRNRGPMPALAGLTRPAARDRHQYGEAEIIAPAVARTRIGSA